MKRTKKIKKMSNLNFNKKSNIKKRKYIKKLRGCAKISNKKSNFKRRKYTKKLRGGVVNPIANPRLLTGSGDDRNVITPTDIAPTDIAPTEIAPTDACANDPANCTVSEKIELFEVWGDPTSQEQKQLKDHLFNEIESHRVTTSCAIYNFFNRYTINFISPVEAITLDQYKQCINKNLDKDTIKELYCKAILKNRLFLEIILIFYNIFKTVGGVKPEDLISIFESDLESDANKYTELFIKLDPWSRIIIGKFNNSIQKISTKQKWGSFLDKENLKLMGKSGVMSLGSSLSTGLSSATELTVGTALFGIGMAAQAAWKRYEASRAPDIVKKTRRSNRLADAAQKKKDKEAAREAARDPAFKKKKEEAKQNAAFDKSVKKAANNILKGLYSNMKQHSNLLLNKIHDIYKDQLKYDGNRITQYISYRNTDYIKEVHAIKSDILKFKDALNGEKDMLQSEYLKTRASALKMNIYLSLFFRQEIEIFLPDIKQIFEYPFQNIPKNSPPAPMIVPCLRSNWNKELRYDNGKFVYKNGEITVEDEKEVILLIKFKNIPQMMPKKNLAKVIPQECKTSKCEPNEDCNYPDHNWERLKSIWGIFLDIVKKDE